MATHKWLVCMLCTANTGSQIRLGTSSPCCVESFPCKQAILGKQGCCNARPLQIFQRHMVIPVACFGAAHRKVYKQDLCKMDIVFRRLLRSIVGPPGDVDWTLPWQEILHHWNERVKFFTSRHG